MNEDWKFGTGLLQMVSIASAHYFPGVPCMYQPEEEVSGLDIVDLYGGKRVGGEVPHALPRQPSELPLHRRRALAALGATGHKMSKAALNKELVME
jgi:hypothetical protein